MTTARKVLIQSQDAPIVQAALYTAVNLTATIDKLTATNTTPGAVMISVNLVPGGDVVGSGNLIAKTVSIAAGGSYNFPEVVGHDLADGDSISVLASAAGVTVRASGRETTTN